MNRFFALLILGSPLVAFGATNPDASFFKHAAEGGLAEVDAGNLAQQKAGAQNVKDFGAMMVKDHSAANDKLQSIATAKGITLPSSPSIGQMATKAKLDVLSGTTFDTSYIKGQVRAHEQTVGLFRKEIASGQDADAKAFAKDTLPTVRSHLKAIKAIAAQAGVAIK